MGTQLLGEKELSRRQQDASCFCENMLMSGRSVATEKDQGDCEEMLSEVAAFYYKSW